MAIIEGWRHKSWGDNINFFDWNTRKIYGLMTPKPKIGDEYRERTLSGQIYCFKIVAMEFPGDPHDMFFADVEDIGILIEAT